VASGVAYLLKQEGIYASPQRARSNFKRREDRRKGEKRSGGAVPAQTTFNGRRHEAKD
jgi:hypothetical protein